MFDIPIARYRLSCLAIDNIDLPEYSGSVLRGIFGHALRHMLCLTSETFCERCALYRTCTFPAIFKPPAPPSHPLQKFSELPAPYVIEPLPWDTHSIARGTYFHFHFVVLGRAHQHLSLYIRAWQRALERGIGQRRGRARLLEVYHVLPHAETPIWSERSPALAPHTARLPDLPPAPDAVELEFFTPLRLQHNGKPLAPQELRPERLLVGLVKRIGLVLETHGPEQPIPIDYAGLARRAREIRDIRWLHWRDWARYSNTQKRHMKLGGVIGRWRLLGELLPFWPFLYAGQWFHVGKNATFGLGGYRLHPPPEST